MEKVSNPMHLGDGWVYYLCRERATEEVKPPPITVSPAGISTAQRGDPGWKDDQRPMIPPSAKHLVRDPRFQRFVEAKWQLAIRYTDSAVAATAFIGNLAAEALRPHGDPVDVELALDALLETFRHWEIEVGYRKPEEPS